MRSPLLIFDLTLSTALLALGDADEGVDDYNEEDGAADAGANGNLGSVGKTCPLLLGLFFGAEFVEQFVDFGFATGRKILVTASVKGLCVVTYSLTLMLSWLPDSSE